MTNTNNDCEKGMMAATDLMDQFENDSGVTNLIESHKGMLTAIMTAILIKCEHQDYDGINGLDVIEESKCRASELSQAFNMIKKK